MWNLFKKKKEEPQEVDNEKQSIDWKLVEDRERKIKSLQRELEILGYAIASQILYNGGPVKVDHWYDRGDGYWYQELSEEILPPELFSASVTSEVYGRYETVYIEIPFEEATKERVHKETYKALLELEEMRQNHIASKQPKIKYE